MSGFIRIGPPITFRSHRNHVRPHDVLPILLRNGIRTDAAGSNAGRTSSYICLQLT